MESAEARSEGNSEGVVEREAPGEAEGKAGVCQILRRETPNVTKAAVGVTGIKLHKLHSLVLSHKTDCGGIILIQPGKPDYICPASNTQFYL